MRLDPRQLTPEQLHDYRRGFARGENIIEDSRDTGAVFSYETNGVPYAVAFIGKAGKAFWHYRFRSLERRAQAIAEFWNDRQAEEERKKQRRVERKGDAIKMAQQIQVGTILSGSWGYDQTNTELWQVIERRGLAVWIRPIAHETVEGSEGFMSEMVRPKPGQFCGPAVKRLIGPYGVKISSYCALSPCEANSKHYSSWYA